LFFGDGYGDLSDMARHYVGGLLKHAPSLLAFTNPTVNSYRRLVPGYEAPVNLVYSARNRSACIRIPITGSNPKAKRIEFRCPDPSSNPYLAFAAMLMAGLDGIINKIEPPAPVDKDLYELTGAEAAAIPQVPGSLDEVLNKLSSSCISTSKNCFKTKPAPIGAGFVVSSGFSNYHLSLFCLNPTAEHRFHKVSAQVHHPFSAL
jgi:glutamine synthetase